MAKSTHRSKKPSAEAKKYVIHGSYKPGNRKRPKQGTGHSAVVKTMQTPEEAETGARCIVCMKPRPPWTYPIHDKCRRRKD